MKTRNKKSLQPLFNILLSFQIIIIIIIIIHNVPVNPLDDDQNLLPRAVGMWLPIHDGVAKLLF